MIFNAGLLDTMLLIQYYKIMVKKRIMVVIIPNLKMHSLS